MYKLDTKIVITLIIVLAFSFRFYKLSSYPVHLNHDEITQLYDAISVAQTGKDIYGNFMPFIFESIGDFKPPFYTYITVLTYFILGNHEWIIRVPGALFGGLLPLAVFVFSNKLFGNFKISLIAAFLTAISPFEIFYSRKSFENGIGIFFMLLGFSFLLGYVKGNNKKKMLFGGVITLAFTMYTYFSHAILVPLLLMIFVLIFKDVFLKFKKISIQVLLVFLAVVLPLFYFILTNPGTRFRSQTVFITQDKNFSYLMSLGGDRLVNLTNYSFIRYLEHFRLDYLFGFGLDLTNEIPIDVGLLLFITLPFLILGLIYLIKVQNLSNEKWFLAFLILIGMVPSGITFEQFSPHRSIIVFTILNIIIASGIYWFLIWTGKLKKILRGLILLGGILLVSFNLLYFAHLYSINFPNEKSVSIHYPFKQLAEYAWLNYDKYDQIIVDPKFGEVSPIGAVGAHYYFAYFGNYPPAKFQKNYIRDKNFFKFDKFTIRSVDWSKDKDLQKALIFASPWSIQVESEKILKKFYFYDGEIAYYAIETD